MTDTFLNEEERTGRLISKERTLKADLFDYLKVADITSDHAEKYLNFKKFDEKRFRLMEKISNEKQIIFDCDRKIIATARVIDFSNKENARKSLELTSLIRERDILMKLMKFATNYFPALIGCFYQCEAKVSVISKFYLITEGVFYTLREMKDARIKVKQENRMNISSKDKGIQQLFPYEREEALSIYRSLAYALKILEDNKIYHSNITPDSIIFNEELNQYQISDFSQGSFYSKPSDKCYFDFYAKQRNAYNSPQLRDIQAEIKKHKIEEPCVREKSNIFEAAKENEKNYLDFEAKIMPLLKRIYYNPFKADFWSLSKVVAELADFDFENKDSKEIFRWSLNIEEQGDAKSIIEILDRKNLGFGAIGSEDILSDSDIVRLIEKKQKSQWRVKIDARENFSIEERIHLTQRDIELIKMRDNKDYSELMEASLKIKLGNQQRFSRYFIFYLNFNIYSHKLLTNIPF
jgi:serine/threonine protein kinase